MLYLNQFFRLAMRHWVVVSGSGDSWFQLWWNLTWCPTLAIFITEQMLRKTTVPCWILLGTCRTTGATVIIIEWCFLGFIYIVILDLLSCSFSVFLLKGFHARQPHLNPPVPHWWWWTVLAHCLVLADEFAHWTKLFFCSFSAVVFCRVKF